MTHPSDEMRDDAPLSASKHTDQAIAVANASLPGPDGSSLIGRTVTINRPRHELYAYWRNFALLPTFLDNVERVDVLDNVRSHWVVKAPAGATVEWDTVITEESLDEYIAWSSDDNSQIDHKGRIEFADAGDRGTIVTATILYNPPAGMIGKLAAKLFQREPTIQARRDLRRFKQLMETGEVATSSRTRAQLLEEQI